ncbi:ATP-binding protein [Paenibacillus sp. 481]|uniref:ATP-binding protein n=1 Tax=Paenibacillus sp. 481 TaxID=2835869 RepID=UPI001E478B19|nr:ATP-binding protein [Paenibacillus sp. 481]UHA73455.1 AAA family ATPase [Paenibacillus sp. 481]
MSTYTLGGEVLVNRTVNEKSRTAYSRVWEHLHDELLLLDLKLHAIWHKRNAAGADNPFDHLKGLVMSEQEILYWLNEPTVDHDEDIDFRIRALEEEIEARLQLCTKLQAVTPLQYVSIVFGLSAYEARCIMICLAPEVHRKYEKIYAYLQDDVTRKSASVDLILQLTEGEWEEKFQARSYLSAGSTLQRFFFTSHTQVSGHTLLSKSLQLDEKIVAFMLGANKLDDRLSPFCEMIYPSGQLSELLVDKQLQDKLKAFAGRMYESDSHSDSKGQQGLLICISGAAGSGKLFHVKHFCQHFLHPLLVVDVRRMLQEDKPFDELITHLIREAVLQQAVICFRHIEASLQQDPAISKKLDLIISSMKYFPRAVFFLSERAWKPNIAVQRRCMDAEIDIPDEGQREKLWSKMSQPYVCDQAGISWGTLAGAFRFTPGRIEQALEQAHTISLWDVAEGGRIRYEHVVAACYRGAQHQLETKSTRIKPKYGWADVILPLEQMEQLRNACNQIKYRHIVFGEWGFSQKLSYGKGVSMLFSGPPGTGKTMAAEVIAGELALQMYKIDLAQVVSKYIGETEKNLHDIFREAQLSHAILFFDECDALFGKRSEVKDSHDKYANMETSFLLQKMEEYEGITIMATNYAQNIDEAFLRRISYVVKFPFPDATYREGIWRSLYPKEAPVSDEVDYAYLGRKLELSGGHIKNIVVSSAFLAAEAGESIGMRHILQAARYELLKNGKIMSNRDWDEYAED